MALCRCYKCDFFLFHHAWCPKCNDYPKVFLLLIFCASQCNYNCHSFSLSLISTVILLFHASTAFLSVILLSANNHLYVSTVQNTSCLIFPLNCYSKFFPNCLSIYHFLISPLCSVCVHSAECFMPHILSQLPFQLPFAFVASS